MVYNQFCFCCKNIKYKIYLFEKYTKQIYRLENDCLCCECISIKFAWFQTNCPKFTNLTAKIHTINYGDLQPKTNTDYNLHWIAQFRKSTVQLNIFELNGTFSWLLNFWGSMHCKYIANVLQIMRIQRKRTDFSFLGRFLSILWDNCG